MQKIITIITITIMALALALVASASAQTEPLPRLTKSDAQFYVKQTLKRNFGIKYTSRVPYGNPPPSCTRVTTSNFKCSVSWLAQYPAANLFYRGKVWIWYSRNENGELWWNYSYTIRSYLCGEGTCILKKVYRVNP